MCASISIENVRLETALSWWSNNRPFNLGVHGMDCDIFWVEPGSKACCNRCELTVSCPTWSDVILIARIDCVKCATGRRAERNRHPAPVRRFPSWKWRRRGEVLALCGNRWRTTPANSDNTPWLLDWRGMEMPDSSDTGRIDRFRQMWSMETVKRTSVTHRLLLLPLYL
jgi:hypothetical protein